MKQPFDLLIVGGGINGAGIARDAAGRGLKVLLVEQDDLAAHTSSASTKLIHGGLRYLEMGDLRLVRESLIERERLLRMAPHIIRPLEFVVPQADSPRPAWLVRLGLFVYDHLGGRRHLPATRTVRLDDHPFGTGLKHRRGKAFVYSDCRVDDSRLVILNAVDARERGAEIRTRTQLVHARREADLWLAVLRDAQGERQVRSRILVNAAGPWVGELFGRIEGARPRRKIRLVKGSHIVLPALYPGEHAFLIQNSDRRVVFAIPFEGEFTLVGTTDRWWNGAPGKPKIDEEEIAYLLETGPPLLSIYGGKITTYRRLAEQALERLARFLPGLPPAWTGGSVLPGADRVDLEQRYPALPASLIQRLADSYGSRSERLLADARTVAALGEDFGAGLTAREVDYLIGQEWARSAEDILVRRSKLGLHLSSEAADRLERYVDARLTRTDNAA